MDNIKVSIVVPVFNGAEYLKDCYEQLAKQTLDNIEIIIIDDGSKDSTAEIGLKLEKLNENCHFFHQENQGASAARNFGISKTTGDYIGFVDVDDKYDNDMYEVLYKAASENNLDIVAMENYGSKGELTIVDDKKEIFNMFLCKKIKMSACFKLFKRCLFTEMSFPVGVQIYEDYSAVYKGLKAASRIGLLNENKYHYIKHEGSNSREKIFQEKYLNMISVVDETCDDIVSQYPELTEACNRRKAITYLRISKIYYMRKHPAEYKNKILEFKKWLKTIPYKNARHYYSVFDLTRHYLYLYAFPLFYLLIKTVDKE